MVSIDKTINRTVARMCADATFEEANTRALGVRSRLERHRKTGEHKVTVTRGKKSDAFVNLEGYAPGAVEFGHFDKQTGEWVPGIFVLTREI